MISNCIIELYVSFLSGWVNRKLYCFSSLGHTLKADGWQNVVILVICNILYFTTNIFIYPAIIFANLVKVFSLKTCMQLRKKWFVNLFKSLTWWSKINVSRLASPIFPYIDHKSPNLEPYCQNIVPKWHNLVSHYHYILNVCIPACLKAFVSPSSWTNLTAAANVSRSSLSAKQMPLWHFTNNTNSKINKSVFFIANCLNYF